MRKPSSHETRLYKFLIKYLFNLNKDVSLYRDKSPFVTLRKSNFSFKRVYWFFAGKENQNKYRLFFESDKSNAGLYDYVIRLPFELITKFILGLVVLVAVAGYYLTKGGLSLVKDTFKTASRDALAFIYMPVASLALIITGGAISIAAFALAGLIYVLYVATMKVIDKAIVPILGLITSAVLSPVTLVDWIVNRNKLKLDQPDLVNTAGSSKAIMHVTGVQVVEVKSQNKNQTQKKADSDLLLSVEIPALQVPQDQQKFDKSSVLSIRPKMS